MAMHFGLTRAPAEVAPPDDRAIIRPMPADPRQKLGQHRDDDRQPSREPTLPTQEDEDRFYAALGRAITNWSSLETQLFEVTHLILGCAREIASIVFYRTPTVDSRLTLTSDLVDFVLRNHGSGDGHDPMRKTWEKLQRDIRGKLSIRNSLAHQPVGSLTSIYESTDQKELKFAITTASYMSLTAHLRRPSRSPGIVRLRDIEAHIEVVTGLSNELMSFRNLLAERIKTVDL